MKQGGKEGRRERKQEEGKTIGAGGEVRDGGEERRCGCLEGDMQDESD